MKAKMLEAGVAESMRTLRYRRERAKAQKSEFSEEYQGYTPLNQKTRSAWRRGLIGAVGIGVFFLGIMASSVYGIAGGFLIWVSSLFHKTIVVDEAGVQMYGDATLYKYEERWTFEEIDSIHKETGRKTGLVMLHFGKDVMTRRLLFSEAVADEVIRLAKAKNPRIYVDVTR